MNKIKTPKGGILFYKFKSIINSLIRITYLKLGGMRNTMSIVEVHYDKVIDKKCSIYGYRNGKIVYSTNEILYDKQVIEYANILKQFKFNNILEVGAGELAVFRIFSKIFKNKDYHAVDISQNRIERGKKKFPECKYIKANAITLPYKDNEFDIVITSHCLEQIKYNYKEAINELCRVGKVVVLFEPSYELGCFIQKLRILAQDYVKGIPQYIKKFGKTQVFLLENSESIHNRPACHIIIK